MKLKDLVTKRRMLISAILLAVGILIAAGTMQMLRPGERPEDDIGWILQAPDGTKLIEVPPTEPRKGYTYFVYKDFIFYKTLGPGEDQSSIVCYDIKNRRARTLATSKYEDEFNPGFCAIGNTVYFSLRQDDFRNVYCIDHPFNDEPKLLYIGGDGLGTASIHYSRGLYWVWMDYFMSDYVSYCLLDPEAKKMTHIKMVSFYDKYGLDNQHRMLVATAGLDDPKTLKYVERFSIYSPSSRETIISRAKMPADIKDMELSKEEDKLLLFGKENYEFDLATKKLIKNPKLKRGTPLSVLGFQEPGNGGINETGDILPKGYKIITTREYVERRSWVLEGPKRQLSIMSLKQLKAYFIYKDFIFLKYNNFDGRKIIASYDLKNEKGTVLLKDENDDSDPKFCAKDDTVYFSFSPSGKQGLYSLKYPFVGAPTLLGPDYPTASKEVYGKKGMNYSGDKLPEGYSIVLKRTLEIWTGITDDLDLGAMKSGTLETESSKAKPVKIKGNAVLTQEAQ